MTSSETFFLMGSNPIRLMYVLRMGLEEYLQKRKKGVISVIPCDNA